LVLFMTVVAVTGLAPVAIIEHLYRRNAGPVLRAVAGQLRFDFEEGVARGRLAHEIEVRWVADPDGMFEVEALFGADLGMGLSVKPTFRAQDEPAPNLGWQFHDTLHVESWARDQAIELLRPLVSTLLRLRERYDVLADDQSLRLRARADATAAELVELAGEADALAGSLVARRALIPSSFRERRARSLLDRLAERLGGERAGAAVETETDAGHLELRFEHAPPGMGCLELALDFDPPLPVTLSLTEEAARSNWDRLRHPDIQLSDAEFDRTFIVRGEPEGEVRAILTEPARRALLELQRRARELAVSRDAITCTLHGDEPALDMVVDVVRALEACAEALSRRPRIGGPYRGTAERSAPG
jgi:hypothetical protein